MFRGFLGDDPPGQNDGATSKSRRYFIAELFSTVGLVIDVTAVLALIILSHAESGMARIIGTTEGICQGLVLRFKVMARRSKTLLVLNIICVAGLFVGTTLMILGIWM